MTARHHDQLAEYEAMCARPSFLLLMATWHTFFAVACAGGLFMER